MLLSINQISELTGQDRRTIVKRLEDLPFQPRDKNACLYSSTEALPAVYAMAFAVVRGSRLREDSHDALIRVYDAADNAICIPTKSAMQAAE